MALGMIYFGGVLFWGYFILGYFLLGAAEASQVQIPPGVSNEGISPRKTEFSFSEAKMMQEMIPEPDSLGKCFEDTEEKVTALG